MRAVTLAASLFGLLLLAGCSQRPAWNDDPKAGRAEFWVDRPAAAAVVADDYASLFDAAQDAADRFGFAVGMSDYRGGLLVTETQVSGQWYEPWRDETSLLRSPAAVLEASLSTVRRSLRFTIEPIEGEEAFRLTPVVLVEREVRGERPVTNAADYTRILGNGSFRRDELGRRETTRGWYVSGRDASLERSLANRIAKRANGRIERSPAS